MEDKDVTAMAEYTKGEKRILAVGEGGNDLSLVLYNIETKEVIQELGQIHDNDICNIVFSSNGKYIATSSKGVDQRINVFEFNETGTLGKPLIFKEVLEDNDDNFITSLLVADDKNVFSGWKNGKIIVFFPKDNESYDEKEFSDHKTEITSLVLETSKKILISGSLDGQLKIWNLITLSFLSDLEDLRIPINGIKCLLLLPEDKLASGSDDSLIRIWDISTVQSPILKPAKSIAKASNEKLQTEEIKQQTINPNKQPINQQYPIRIFGHTKTVTHLLLKNVSQKSPITYRIISASVDASIRI